MKWSLVAVALTTTVLAACNSSSDSLKARAPLPVSAKTAAEKAAAEAAVEGAFTVPANSRSVNLAPVSVGSAHLLFGAELTALTNIKCMGNVLDALAYTTEPTLRMETKSQVIARQNTAETIPDSNAEEPLQFVSFNCKTSPPRDQTPSVKDSDEQDDASSGTGLGRSRRPRTRMTPAPTPVAAATPAPTPTPAVSPTPATAEALAKTLPENVKLRTLIPNSFGAFHIFLAKDQDEAISVKVECHDASKLAEAPKFLATEIQGHRPADFLIGPKTKLLLTLKKKAGAAKAEYQLVTCGLF